MQVLAKLPPIAHSHNRGTHEKTYSLRGELLSVKRPDGAGSLTITYTYDPAGNRTTFQNEVGGTQTYTYDAADRVTRIEDPSNEITT